MKQFKKDLKGLSRQLRALSKKTERIAKAIEKLERPKAPRQRGTKVAASSRKMAYAKRHTAGKKTAALTATDQVIEIINKAKKGVDVSTLVKKSGFQDKKVRDILSRAFKEGRVSRVGRGIYGPQKERRRHSRIGSLNLVSYTCIGKDNQVVRQAMGRTLDVTEEGILLETHLPINPQHRVSLTIGVKDDLVDVDGRVVHSRPAKAGRFQSGIQFEKMNKTSLAMLKKFIAAFKNQQRGDEASG